MRRLFTLLCLLLWVSACQPLSVNTQADPYTDFSGYKSFDWLPENGSPLTGERALLAQQLRFAVERELQAKGVTKDVQQPDLMIGFYGSSKQKSAERTIESVDYWGDRRRYPFYNDPLLGDPLSKDSNAHLYPERRGGSYRSIETQTIEYKEGTLVIDFLDTKSMQLLWRATLQGVIDERDPAGQLDKAVIKALEQYPPQP